MFFRHNDFNHTYLHGFGDNVKHTYLHGFGGTSGSFTDAVARKGSADYTKCDSSNRWSMTHQRLITRPDADEPGSEEDKPSNTTTNNCKSACLDTGARERCEVQPQPRSCYQQVCPREHNGINKMRDPTLTEFYNMAKSTRARLPHLEEPARPLLAIEDLRDAVGGHDDVRVPPPLHDDDEDQQTCSGESDDDSETSGSEHSESYDQYVAARQRVIAIIEEGLSKGVDGEPLVLSVLQAECLPLPATPQELLAQQAWIMEMITICKEEPRACELGQGSGKKMYASAQDLVCRVAPPEPVTGLGGQRAGAHTVGNLLPRGQRALFSH